MRWVIEVGTRQLLTTLKGVLQEASAKIWIKTPPWSALDLCPSYRNVADGFRYLPDGSVCWMFATAGISVGLFYNIGT